MARSWVLLLSCIHFLLLPLLVLGLFLCFLSVLIAAPRCGLREHSSHVIYCGLDVDKIG